MLALARFFRMGDGSSDAGRIAIGRKVLGQLREGLLAHIERFGSVSLVLSSALALEDGLKNRPTHKSSRDGALALLIGIVGATGRVSGHDIRTTGEEGALAYALRVS